MFNLFRKLEDMWLIVGLGNPGEKYARNRHNIGFLGLEEIAADEPTFPAFKSKFQGLYSEARVNTQKTGLLMPLTYMNESGRSVSAAAKFYKIPAERIIVIHDELDLKPGEVKIKQGGGNAGHNGLKSIQAHLGTPNFWRMRMGIGHPGQKDQVSNYVLSDFSNVEMEGWVEQLLQKLSKNFTDLLDDNPKQIEEKLR